MGFCMKSQSTNPYLNFGMEVLKVHVNQVHVVPEDSGSK